MYSVDIKNEDHTIGLAQNIAKALQPSDILCLHGDLGAGKTFFCRHLIRAITRNPDQDVPSPTFTLLQTYSAQDTEIYHFDLYRLSDPDEMYEIGWEDALQNGIILVEWPDRLGHHSDDIAPETLLNIQIEISDQSPDERVFHISEALNENNDHENRTENGAANTVYTRVLNQLNTR